MLQAAQWLRSGSRAAPKEVWDVVPPRVSGCSLYVDQLSFKRDRGPRGAAVLHGTVTLSIIYSNELYMGGRTGWSACERHSSASRLPMLCAFSEFQDMQYGARWTSPPASRSVGSLGARPVPHQLGTRGVHDTDQGNTCDIVPSTDMQRRFTQSRSADTWLSDRGRVTPASPGAIRRG